MFIWLGLLSCIFLFLQSAFVWAVLRRKHREFNRYSVLNEEDDDDDEDDTLDGDGDVIVKSNNHKLKPLKGRNGNAIIDLNDHENTDSDSQIEFEQRQQYS